MLDVKRGMDAQAMIAIPETTPVPLGVDRDGVVRINGTRVTLDLVLGAYNDGVSAEEIVQQFTTLKLADVYAVIAYYLRSKEEIDAYLAAGEEEAERLQREIEAQFNPVGLRARLLARRSPEGQK